MALLSRAGEPRLSALRSYFSRLLSCQPVRYPPRRLPLSDEQVAGVWCLRDDGRIGVTHQVAGERATRGYTLRVRRNDGRGRDERRLLLGSRRRAEAQRQHEPDGDDQHYREAIVNTWPFGCMEPKTHSAKLGHAVPRLNRQDYSSAYLSMSARGDRARWPRSRPARASES